MARILFSLSSYGTGGREKQLTEIVRGLKGHSLHLMLKNYSGHFFPSVKDRLDSYLDMKLKKLSFSGPLRMISYIREIKPDIVIPFCFTSANIILAIKHIMLMDYKILCYTIRDTMPFGNRLYIPNRIFLSLQRHVIANSGAGLKAYGQEGRKGRYLIKNGIDLSSIPLISRKEARQALGLEQSLFIVSMLARLDDSKDHRTLLDTALILKDRGILFLIIGDGKNKKSIKDRIKQLGLEDTVRMLGYRSDVYDILTASDISLLLSFKEGIPNAVLESYACSRPVIASGSGGLEEIICHGTDGFLLSQGNAGAVADKILYLMDNPQITCEMGKNARQKILCDFSSQRLISELNTLINKILG